VTLTHIFLLDTRRCCACSAAGESVAGTPEMELTELADDHIVSCDIHAKERRWRSCSTSTTCGPAGGGL